MKNLAGIGNAVDLYLFIGLVCSLCGNYMLQKTRGANWELSPVETLWTLRFAFVFLAFLIGMT